MGHQARHCIAFESQGIAVSCGLQTGRGTRYGGMFGQVHDRIQLVAERRQVYDRIQLVAERKLSIPQRRDVDAQGPMATRERVYSLS